VAGIDEELDRASVARDHIDAPFLTDNAPENGIDSHGCAIPGVVRGHDGFGASFLKTHPEGHRIVLPEEALVEVGGGAFAKILVAVSQEVLEQCCRLPVLRIVSLQSFDKSNGHRPVEERILPIDLFAAAPARIARQIGLRSPEHQNLAIVLCGLSNESRFIALDARSFENQLGIPRLTHAWRLGELRGCDRFALVLRFALDDPVDAFRVPKAHDAEPRHPGVGAQAADLLVNRHEGEQVVDPPLRGQRRIVEWITGLLGAGGDERRSETGDQKTEQSGKAFLHHGGECNSFLGEGPDSAGSRPAQFDLQTQNGYRVRDLLLSPKSSA